uniref:Uncharacterized protein n=1 Tax=Rhizophora mucronata TaxID=61149 RepID=A0A2P2N0M2_RHIMU
MNSRLSYPPGQMYHFSSVSVYQVSFYDSTQIENSKHKVMKERILAKALTTTQLYIQSCII